MNPEINLTAWVNNIAGSALQIRDSSYRNQAIISAPYALALAFIEEGRGLIRWSFNRLVSQKTSVADSLNSYLVNMRPDEQQNFYNGTGSLILGSALSGIEATIAHGYQDAHYLSPFNNAVVGTPIPAEPTPGLKNLLDDNQDTLLGNEEETRRITNLAILDPSLIVIFARPYQNYTFQGLQNMEQILEEIEYENIDLPQIIRLQLRVRPPEIQLAFRSLVQIYRLAIQKVMQATPSGPRFARKTDEDWRHEVPSFYDQFFADLSQDNQFSLKATILTTKNMTWLKEINDKLGTN